MYTLILLQILCTEENLIHDVEHFFCLGLDKSVQNVAVLALLQFNKFHSVLLQIYNKNAVNGCCPVKELDEDGSKTSDDSEKSFGVKGKEDDDTKEEAEAGAGKVSCRQD